MLAAGASPCHFAPSLPNLERKWRFQIYMEDVYDLLSGVDAAAAPSGPPPKLKVKRQMIEGS